MTAPTTYIVPLTTLDDINATFNDTQQGTDRLLITLSRQHWEGMGRPGWVEVTVQVAAR